MQPKFDQNKKKLKSLLSILDTMEWWIKLSHATVPLRSLNCFQDLHNLWRCLNMFAKFWKTFRCWHILMTCWWRCTIALVYDEKIRKIPLQGAIYNFLFIAVITEGLAALQWKSIHVFPEKELRGLSLNFHMHVSVSDLYSVFPGSVHILGPE